MTVTIAEVHKETYRKPKVKKSIAKTEQDNKTDFAQWRVLSIGRDG